MSNESGREVRSRPAYRIAMRLLGILLLGTAVLATASLTRVIMEMARSPGGSGPLITPAPPGWMVALISGVIGLAAVGCLATLGVAALLVRRWAAWTTLILGVVASAIVLAFQGLWMLMGEPTNLVAASAGPVMAVVLSAAGIWLSRRGKDVTG